MDRNSYLRQIQPTCAIPSWTINRAVKKVMKLSETDQECSGTDLFADTQTSQFHPIPIQDKLAFGRDMLPKLIRKLEVTRRDRTLTILHSLRSLDRLLSDPELCLEALELNVLKPLTSLLMLQTAQIVKLWSLACLRVVAGNPHGITCIIKKSYLLNEIFERFKSPELPVRQMAYSVLGRLSENWFGVPELQNNGCIKIVVEALFELSNEEILHENSIACLLDTLANLMDHRNGAIKAIRYDLFELKWLASCGYVKIERAMLRVFSRLGKDEIGRIGLVRKKIADGLFAALSSDALEKEVFDQEQYMQIETAILQFATLPSERRTQFLNSEVICGLVSAFELPNLPKPSRLSLVKLMTNLAETPDGRSALRQHLISFVAVNLCDGEIQRSVETLIRKIVWQT